RLLRVLRGPSAVECAAVSKDGRLVVTGSADGKVRIWDVSGRLLRTLDVGRPIRAVILSNRTLRLLVLTGERFAPIFDISTGARVLTLEQGGAITSAAFSPGGKLVATGGRDHLTRIWDAQRG